jgi:hypothetical protein
LAAPGLVGVARKVGGAEGQIPNDALGIQDQGDIGPGFDQGGDIVRAEVAQKLLGAFEVMRIRA